MFTQKLRMNEHITTLIIISSIILISGNQETLYDDEINTITLRTFSSDLQYNETCVSCPLGTFSNKFNPVSANCTEYCGEGGCPLNFTDTGCIECGPGQFNNQYNATKCYNCAPGSISSSPGATNCTVCQPGTQNNTLSTFCMPCPAGTEAPLEGSSKCGACAAGTFSEQGSSGCSQCPIGTYNERRGRPFCTPCGVGKFNPEVGSASPTACSTCPAGYYCAQNNTARPSQCPAGTYCESGSANPTPCQLLFQSDTASSTCHAKPALYVIVAVASTVVVTILVGIVWWRTRTNSADLDEENYPRLGSETKPFIPVPTEGPIYNGL